MVCPSTESQVRWRARLLNALGILQALFWCVLMSAISALFVGVVWGVFHLVWVAVRGIFGG